jgi:hypothetical protein
MAVTGLTWSATEPAMVHLKMFKSLYRGGSMDEVEIIHYSLRFAFEVLDRLFNSINFALQYLVAGK